MTTTPTPPEAGKDVANAKPSDNDLLISAGVHALGIVSGFLGALIVYLVKKDEPSPLLDHAKEALNFQITVAIAYAISFVTVFLLIGFFLMWAVSIANFVLCLVAAIQAYQQKPFKYPFTLRLIK